MGIEQKISTVKEIRDLSEDKIWAESMAVLLRSARVFRKVCLGLWMGLIFSIILPLSLLGLIENSSSVDFATPFSVSGSFQFWAMGGLFVVSLFLFFYMAREKTWLKILGVIRN